MNTNNVIEINNLCKTYKDFRLDNLTLTLPGGCILGLVGENGAGKSTTIKLLLDMIKRDSGEIKILGKDIQNNFRLTKSDIGVVLDNAGFSESLNAKQIGRIMSMSYEKWDSDVYNSFFKKLEIPENKKIKEFSRGMKMKLSIAVALSHNAKLLILDEATNGLDPVVRDEITDLFIDFTSDEEHAILIASHIVSDLEKICDYIAFLHKGKLLLCEEKDRLREDYAVMHCTLEALEKIDRTAIVGKRVTKYGAEAIVQKHKVPASVETRPVTIEELFVFMIKGER